MNALYHSLTHRSTYLGVSEDAYSVVLQTRPGTQGHQPLAAIAATVRR